MDRIPQLPSVYIEQIMAAREYDCKENILHNLEGTNENTLLFVQSGSLMLEESNQKKILNTNQLFITQLAKNFQFYSLTPTTRIILITFIPREPLTKFIVNKQINLDDDAASLMAKLNQEIQEIDFQKKRRPSMIYDKEFGDLYTIACSLIYIYLTEVLLIITQKNLIDSLPTSVIKENFKHLSTKKVITHKSTVVSAIDSKTSNTLVEEIIDFLKTNLDKNLSIEDIAQEFLLGSSNLKKIFKKETGQSIITYFKELKMQVAKRLVRENHLSYTEIAEKLGFGSLHHFSAAFKKSTGYSPSQYAERVQRNKQESLSKTELIVNQRPWST